MQCTARSTLHNYCYEGGNICFALFLCFIYLLFKMSGIFFFFWTLVLTGISFSTAFGRSRIQTWVRWWSLALCDVSVQCDRKSLQTHGHELWKFVCVVVKGVTIPQYNTRDVKYRQSNLINLVYFAHLDQLNFFMTLYSIFSLPITMSLAHSLFCSSSLPPPPPTPSSFLLLPPP